MSELQNEAAIFPDFQQELGQKAQHNLALFLGQQTLASNTANAAAEVYAGRLQHMERLYAEASKGLKELDASVLELREQIAHPIPDLSKIDIDTLRIELARRGYSLFPLAVPYESAPYDPVANCADVADVADVVTSDVADVIDTAEVQ